MTATYIVQRGDNLTKIAREHETTVEELVRKNNIKDPNKILIGQKLTLGEVRESNQEVVVTQSEQQTEVFTPQLHEENVGFDTFERNTDTNNQSNGLETAGWVVGGIATYELSKQALPYVFNAAKATGRAVGNATVTGANAVGHGAKVAGTNTSRVLSHAAKKVELEYAFGKDAVKQGLKNTGTTISDATKHAAKKVELEYAFGKDAVKQGVKTASTKGSKIMGLTKLGKIVGRAAMPLAIAASFVEIRDAYKEGGTGAAAKQGVKCASGLACAAAGAKIGAIAGACTGPVAAVAVPVLTAVGAIAGYLGGEKLVDKISSWF